VSLYSEKDAGVPGIRPPLSHDVAEIIRARILSGELSDGAFVRPDRFASAIGLSITPVREAMHMLQSAGLLSLVPRRGFVVLPLSEGDVRDLGIVQAQVSGELAARAARRMTDDELAALRDWHEETADMLRLGQPLSLRSVVTEFQDPIYASARSPKLIWAATWGSAHTPMDVKITLPSCRQAVIGHHDRALAALEARDVPAARQAMLDRETWLADMLATRITQLRARRKATDPAA